MYEELEKLLKIQEGLSNELERVNKERYELSKLKISKDAYLKNKEALIDLASILEKIIEVEKKIVSDFPGILFGSTKELLESQIEKSRDYQNKVLDFLTEHDDLYKQVIDECKDHRNDETNLFFDMIDVDRSVLEIEFEM